MALSIYCKEENIHMQDSEKKKYSILLNGFARLLICLTHEERIEFFQLIQKIRSFENTKKLFKRNFKSFSSFAPKIKFVVLKI